MRACVRAACVRACVRARRAPVYVPEPLIRQCLRMCVSVSLCQCVPARRGHKNLMGISQCVIHAAVSHGPHG